MLFKIRPNDILFSKSISTCEIITEFYNNKETCNFNGKTSFENWKMWSAFG